MGSKDGGVGTLNIPEIQVRQNFEYWQTRYNHGLVQWQLKEVHPHLLKYLSLLTKQGEENKETSETRLKFFLPLCGKTKDIPFLLKLGFEVFGVECVDSVVQELIQENNLNLVYDPTRLLYHTPDEQLKIYCGDLFQCPIEQYGPFDCVWDRASLIALDYPFRKAYMDVMRRSVAHNQQEKHDFRYLLQSVKYDRTRFQGPPRSFNGDDIKEHFASWADVVLLESNLVPSDHPCRQVSGIYDPEFYEEFHLIQPRL